jgi:hypothetical protein
MTLASPDALPPADADARRALRVLVVDDDRTLREGCANILRVDGHQVVACGRGEDAIAAAERQSLRPRARRPVHDAGERHGRAPGRSPPRAPRRSSS